MNDPKEPQILDHDADGITELDNQLPRWWVWLFVLCCVWAGAYLVYFEMLKIGKSSAQVYEAEMSVAKDSAALAAAKAATAAPAEEAPSTDEATLAKGKELFLKNCLPCHGPDGGGLIGPNLCDDHFIHGPTFANHINTIREGVPAKGMITWKNILKPDEIQSVASFIWTLRGTTPATPKAPEGEKAAI